MSIRLLLLSFLFLAACSKAKNNNVGPGLPPIKNDKPGLGKIVIMGDSLANGRGAETEAATPMGCLGEAFGVEVINVAKDGLSSDGITNDPAVRDALKQKPTLIFISLGGNDAIKDHYVKGSFPAQRTMDNMDFVFTGLLRNKALVVYLGLNPPLPGAERLPAITRMAASKGILTFDGLNGFWGDPEKMSDEFHPNEVGYKIICDRILAALKDHYP